MISPKSHKKIIAIPLDRSKNHFSSFGTFQATEALLWTNCRQRYPQQLLLQQQQYRSISFRRRQQRTLGPTELSEKFQMEWPKITLFGDSITRRSVDPDNGCWGSMIHYRVGNYFDIDERGFEGYNSRWGLDLMSKLFPKSYLNKVEIFVLFLGHNDSLEYNHFPAHVPLDEYDSNMRAIIKYLLENGLQPKNIVMITPTWYHLGEFEKFLISLSIPKTGKDFDKAKKYADAVLQIAKDFDIDCMDFFDTSSQYQPLETLFCDGIHLSRTGAKLLFDNLMPILERKIESNLKKPLSELFHVTPFESRPEVKPLLDAHRENMKMKQEQKSNIHVMKE